MMQLHFSIKNILNKINSLLCIVLKVLYFGYSSNRVWPKFVEGTTILYYNLFTKLYFPRKQKLVNIIHQKAKVVFGE